VTEVAGATRGRWSRQQAGRLGSLSSLGSTDPLSTELGAELGLATQQAGDPHGTVVQTHSPTSAFSAFDWSIEGANKICRGWSLFSRSVRQQHLRRLNLDGLAGCPALVINGVEQGCLLEQACISADH